MNWAKAKTYIIILLIALNAILGIFNIFRLQSYSLDSNMVDVSKEVLKKRGFTVECDLPRTYTAMRNIEIKRCSYDYFILKDIFFDESENVLQSLEYGDRLVYSDDNKKKLTIKEDRAIFESSCNPQDIDAITERLVKNVEKQYFVMQKNRDEYANGTRNIVFYQCYNGYLIFNNHLSFEFKDSGEYKTELMYYEPIDFKGSPKDIYTSSEAVYNFSSEAAKLYDISDCAVSDVQIGYFYAGSLAGRDSGFVLHPYYRIFVKGLSEPFYINALNNNMIGLNIVNVKEN